MGGKKACLNRNTAGMWLGYALALALPVHFPESLLSIISASLQYEQQSDELEILSYSERTVKRETFHLRKVSDGTHAVLRTDDGRVVDGQFGLDEASATQRWKQEIPRMNESLPTG